MKNSATKETNAIMPIVQSYDMRQPTGANLQDWTCKKLIYSELSQEMKKQENRVWRERFSAFQLFLAINSEGGMPFSFLNTLLNDDLELKPESSAWANKLKFLFWLALEINSSMR